MESKSPHGQDLALDYLFHPRAIAIPGVSGDLTEVNPGQMLLRALLGAGYKGNIYPVNPSNGEVFGLRIYPNIRDIPGPVDYVISAIPAQYTPQLISDSAAKGVRAVQLFTAGFSETANENGKQLEQEIARKARQSGIRVLGPNCMGLYCPKTGLSFCTEFPTETGSVGYLSQSGGNVMYGVQEAAVRGIRFSKVVSYGNACDLDETEFLEYLTNDPETEVIAAYIEGVKDGPRFMRALKQATDAKPVIVFKGGRTEAGARTTLSHTASIAGSNAVWNSLLRQTGAIQANSVEEMDDVILLFTCMSRPKGRNIAIIGAGGGASVQAADACLEAGLNVPALPAETRQRLNDGLGTEAGYILRNPIDLFPYTGSITTGEAIKLVADCDLFDFLMIHIQVDCTPVADRELLTPYTESIISLARELKGRTAVVIHAVATARGKLAASEAQTALYRAGFPVYPSVSRAANAIGKFIQYHQR